MSAASIPAAAGLALRKWAAFVRRDLRAASSYKLSFAYTLLSVFFSTASFYFIAKLVPSSAPLRSYGGDYYSFAVVGLAFSGLLNIFQEGLPSVIREAQVSGTLEALLVTRTPVSTILVGSSLYAFLFSAARTLVYFLLAAGAFGMRLGRVHADAFVPVLLLTALCYLSLGILSASFILVYKMGNPINWVFGSVSGLLGGALFPVSILPPSVRWISRVLPVTYTLEGMRRSLLASARLHDVLPQVAALGAFGLALLPVSLLVFRAALRKAKKDGTLTQF